MPALSIRRLARSLARSCQFDSVRAERNRRRLVRESARRSRQQQEQRAEDEAERSLEWILSILKRWRRKLAFWILGLDHQLTLAEPGCELRDCLSDDDFGNIFPAMLVGTRLRDLLEANGLVPCLLTSDLFGRIEETDRALTRVNLWREDPSQSKPARFRHCVGVLKDAAASLDRLIPAVQSIVDEVRSSYSQQ